MKYEDGYDGGMSRTSSALFAIGLLGAVFGVGCLVVLALLG